MAGEPLVLDSSSKDPFRPGLFASLRSYAWLIGLLVALGIVAGYSISFLMPTTYASNSTLYLRADRPFDPVGGDMGDPVRHTADQVELVQSSEVLEQAGQRMSPLMTISDIRGSVTAVGATDTSRITITAQGPSPEEARALADAVAGAYLNVVFNQVALRSAAAQDAIEDGFIEQEIRFRASAYGNGVASVDPAVLPTEPASPLPKQNAIVGGIVGLLAGLALAVLLVHRRARRASIADLDLLIGAPLITRYPATPNSVSTTEIANANPTPDCLNAVHDVLEAVDVALEDHREKAVLFLSWQRAITTTSLVVSAGHAAARSGRRVVLVDGGQKERGVSSLTDAEPGGWIESLADPARPIELALRTWELGGTPLGVVPLSSCIANSAGATIRPQVLRSATSRLRSVAPLVLIDGPPLTERSLDLTLGRAVDGVILVIDEKTEIDDVHEMGRRIALSGVNVLGYVLVAQRRGNGGWKRVATSLRSQRVAAPPPIVKETSGAQSV